ncbi:MAG: FecR domain-containing protein [Phycisphaeraceae bacterium]|nr:FecR domain-containing protein [Phycisphaeraceae bacterium]
MDDRTEQLINRYLTGTASDEQIRQLDRLLRKDPAARRAILKASWMDAALFKVCRTMAEPSEPLPAETADAIEQLQAEKPSFTHSIRRPKTRPWFTQPSRLAAILLGALLIGAMAAGSWYAMRPPVAAKITAKDNAVVSAGSAHQVNTLLRQGQRLELLEGSLTVQFNHGALVDLQAPVVFEITDANAGRLQSGRLLATVPPRARGFVVQTEQLLARDFGTVFGVEARADGQVEVHVFSGVVEAELPAPPADSGREPVRPLRLLRDQALHVPEAGHARRIAASSRKFGQSLPWHPGGLRSLALRCVHRKQTYTIGFDSPFVRRLSPGRLRIEQPTEQLAFSGQSDADFDDEHLFLMVEDQLNARGGPGGDRDFEDVQIEVHRDRRDGYDVVTLSMARGSTAVLSRLIDAGGRELLQDPIPTAPESVVYRFRTPSSPQ